MTDLVTWGRYGYEPAPEDASNYTSIQDNLTILLHEALDWLDLPTVFTSCVVRVVEAVADTRYTITLNGLSIFYTSETGEPTDIEIAEGLVAAIKDAAIADLTVTDLLDGSFQLVQGGGSTFDLTLDSYLDLEPHTREALILASLIVAAKCIADGFVNQDFADDDGLVTLPPDIKAAVLQLLQSMWKSWKLGNGKGVVVGPVSSRSVEGQSVSYGTPVTLGGYTIDPLAANMLNRYRVLPGDRNPKYIYPQMITLTQMWQVTSVLSSSGMGSFFDIGVWRSF